VEDGPVRCRQIQHGVDLVAQLELVDEVNHELPAGEQVYTQGDTTVNKTRCEPHTMVLYGTHHATTVCGSVMAISVRCHKLGPLTHGCPQCECVIGVVLSEKLCRLCIALCLLSWWKLLLCSDMLKNVVCQRTRAVREQKKSIAC
jgi:hypothetical protein